MYEKMWEELKAIVVEQEDEKYDKAHKLMTNGKDADYLITSGQAVAFQKIRYMMENMEEEKD